MKTILNCDQVFLRLTAGPFPSGRPDDDQVMHHLEDCMACQRLAEAMRPACNLLHESLQSDERESLPAFFDDSDQAYRRNRQAIMQAILPAETEASVGVGSRSPAPRVGSVLATLAVGIALLVTVGSQFLGANAKHGDPSPTWNVSSLNAACFGGDGDRGSLAGPVSGWKGVECCTQCHHSGATALRPPRFELLLASCGRCHVDG